MSIRAAPVDATSGGILLSNGWAYHHPQERSTKLDIPIVTGMMFIFSFPWKGVITIHDELLKDFHEGFTQCHGRHHPQV